MRRNTLSPEELSIIKDEAAWEEAKQNALAEGRRQEKLEIARAMLAGGAEKSFIAQGTGLPLTEIEGIVLR